MSFISLFGNKSEPEKPEPREPEEPEQKKSGFFSRMREAVTRTRESLGSKIEGIVAMTRTVDESSLADLEMALLSSDIGVQTTNKIIKALRARARRQAIEGGEELRSLLKTQIRSILEAPQK